MPNVRAAACGAFVLTAFVTACGRSDRASPGAPSPTMPVVAEAPTTLPPRTTLEETIKELFQREFGESVYRPAIFYDPRAIACGLAEAQLTSTLYIRSSARRAQLKFVLTSPDGRQLLRRHTNFVIVPQGRFRVLVVLLTFPDTITADSLPLWQSAQAAINDHHNAFAVSRGYSSPLVSFESTNVLIPGSEVTTPNTPAGITAALNARGVSLAGHDFVVTINVDPTKLEGGLAFSAPLDPAFVYVGNHFGLRSVPTATQLQAFAETAYHHEIGHHWGWDHEWTPTCGATRLGFEPLISAPMLFGWEDTDGDRVPEILDLTPYGRSR